MLEIFYTNQFRKDLKLSKKRGKNLPLLVEVVQLLQNHTPLHPRHRDHALTGEMKGFRDLHISPDWLLIYKIDLKRNILFLGRTGSHSDLFG
jgi:mRNA interferase YafQ